MRHMVTGGAGFIGSNTVDELVKRGRSVTGLKRAQVRGTPDYLRAAHCGATQPFERCHVVAGKHPQFAVISETL
ncbi:MAG: hypothetical protein NVS9B5_36330 [Terriglobales bacterium]